ncbi:MAG: exopolysaccharide biosynthesis polyprenyl glycosylphosphotransferase [Oscillospiraceae bacterium]
MRGDKNMIASHHEQIESSLLNSSQVPLKKPMNAFIKRGVDLLLSMILLLLFSPLMLVVCVLIKMTTDGAVIFKQKRIGANQEQFTIYKFSSMKEGAEYIKKFTAKNDSRCTPIGRYIRKFGIDELPQLFNVLKGEMSLIGPRPELPYFVDEFKGKIPQYLCKHEIKPGITGWAQVNGFRGDTSIEQRIQLDLDYIANWSLWFDIKILFLTGVKGIVNENAY